MPDDFKIRRSGALPPPTTPAPQPAVAKPVAVTAPVANPLDASAFETVAGMGVFSTVKRTVAGDAAGRAARGGVADDSVGRSSRGGVADDSVGRSTFGGVADDSVGRSSRGGVADDSVGRSTFDGVADDSVGRSTKGGVADDSVGRSLKTGVADDSVGRSTKGGVADDSVGRSLKTGVADDSVGRSTKGGVADDSVGRSLKTGVADDSVGRSTKGGVADDSVGRSTKGGVADDSVGRNAKGGVADDSVGRNTGVADDSVGRNTGVADDSVGRNTGVADDSVGRNTGVADDSVGRKAQGGVADDSVGTDGLVRIGRDDDEVHQALREGVFQRLETPRSLDATEKVPSQKPNLADSTRLATSLLPSGAAKLLAAAGSDSIAGAHLAAIVKNAADLAPTSQIQLLGLVASDGLRSTSARLADTISSSATWRALPTAGRTQLVSVMSEAGEEGLKNLAALIETRPHALTETDSQGGTLLSSLSQIASQPLNASLASQTSREELLGSTLREIVNPNRIDQGTATTCTVTSMQFELVSDNPAEYARLMANLTGPAGKTVMLGGGTLRLNADDGLVAARDDRAPSSAIFQSAAMEYANGRDDFDPLKQQSTKYDGSKIYMGLHPDQQSRMLTQLFGVKYGTDTLFSEAEGAKALLKLRGFDATANENENRPVLLDLDQGDVNHAVTLERIADGQVFFRDPYGELRSMSEATAVKSVVAIHRPIV